MKQNIYDDPDFFENYQQMRQHTHSLNQVCEHPTIRALLPELTGIRALDIGCGNGDLSVYLAKHGASEVFGVDISERMIALAQQQAINIDEVSFECCAVEDIDLEDNRYELIVSSVAFHYVDDWATTCKKLANALSDEGTLLFSVEHPVLTANKTDWLLDQYGNRKYNIVMDYFKEGERKAEWLGASVVSYHRTFSTLLNSLIASGLVIQQIEEQGFLFVKAVKRELRP